MLNFNYSKLFINFFEHQNHLSSSNDQICTADSNVYSHVMFQLEIRNVELAIEEHLPREAAFRVVRLARSQQHISRRQRLQQGTAR